LLKKIDGVEYRDRSAEEKEIKDRLQMQRELLAQNQDKEDYDHELAMAIEASLRVDDDKDSD
jgi:hypothetical protein